MSSAQLRVAVAGEFVLVFGTSCSSPVVGSMITLINDARIAVGKGPVGACPLATDLSSVLTSVPGPARFYQPSCKTRSSEVWSSFLLTTGGIDLHRCLQARLPRHHDGREPGLR